MADYIKRELEGYLSYISTKYPVVTLTGPRQSGKSTLVRHVFPEKNTYPWRILIRSCLPGKIHAVF